MKRALLTTLALTCHCLANAQSEVTVFGVIDLNITRAKIGRTSALTEGTNGVAPSRLGFRGFEDLGGGLSAGFWLENQYAPDTGGIVGNSLFARRSTVMLISQQWGEFRMGRDYTPTFWNHTYYSPFTTNGVAGSVNVVSGWPNGLGSAQTEGRDNNLIEYFTPKDLGGFYAFVQAAPGEGIDGEKEWGGRFGYGTGPFDAAFAYSQTDANGGKYRQAALGGTYDFKYVKLYGNVFSQSLLRQRQTVSMIGLSVPYDLHCFKLGYSYANSSGTAITGKNVDANDAQMIGVGYNYFLSKRTQLYTTYSRIINKGNSAFKTGDLPLGAAGQNASGFQVGMDHFF